jgi:alkanesulfonate monooxygenase SsuD/methylene tetrahydromethanopterin reductase-like flavin-dependent oxidoreductase (luciferase family)
VIKLGVTLPQFTDDPARLVEGAQAAEDLGLDSIWLFDHLWPLSGGKTRPIFEGWTALPYIAARTDRIKVGTLVTRSALRHPVLLAKMAATVESIAPGRLVLAVGSGDELSRAENEAFGIPYHGGADRVPEMISALQVVRGCFDRSRVSHSSSYHEVRDLPPSPSPSPSPPLWVGGRSPEVLAAAGDLCDGWNSWGSSPRRFAREAGKVRAAAGGRTVELSWGGQVILAETDSAAEDLLGERPRRSFVLGGPETVAARFSALAFAGAEHLIAAFPFAGPESYGLLAGPVRKQLS